MADDVRFGARAWPWRRLRRARAERAAGRRRASIPLYDSQKAAFDALPEADRRAIQDSLVWSGHYLGVVDGVFGKRTRDAIVAYQTSVKAPANGLVDAAQLAAMTGAAQKARAAVRFQIFTDDKTGVKIGAPLKILDKRVASDSGGVRLMKADGSITLDLSNAAGGDAKTGHALCRAHRRRAGEKNYAEGQSS